MRAKTDMDESERDESEWDESERDESERGESEWDESGRATGSATACTAPAPHPVSPPYAPGVALCEGDGAWWTW